MTSVTLDQNFTLGFFFSELSNFSCTNKLDENCQQMKDYIWGDIIIIQNNAILQQEWLKFANIWK